VQALPARRAEQRPAEIKLQRGFSAAERETAAGGLVINPVAKNNAHHFIDCHPPTKGAKLP